MNCNEKILVGKIVAPQGIRGEVRVQTFTENPNDFQQFTIHNSQFTIKFVRVAGPNIVICKIDGVDDRNAAENLRGTELFINRSDLPELKKGEHYVADLIGMRVIRCPDATMSRCHVVTVHNFGAGDILELDNGDMISFNGAIVDYENKTITIN